MGKTKKKHKDLADYTHVEMLVSSKTELEKIRDDLGLRSMAIVIQQILDGTIKIKNKNKK